MNKGNLKIPPNRVAQSARGLSVCWEIDFVKNVLCFLSAPQVDVCLQILHDSMDSDWTGTRQPPTPSP